MDYLSQFKPFVSGPRVLGCLEQDFRHLLCNDEIVEGQTFNLIRKKRHKIERMRSLQQTTSLEESIIQ